MLRTKKMVSMSLLVGVGLVLHFVENMIPMAFIVPGAKIGLANISNLLGMVLFGFAGGFQVLLLRIILGSLLAGTFMTLNFYLSLSGGLLGYLAMALGYYLLKDKFSLLGISVIGALFHNTGQLITASYIISSQAIFYYLPYLLLMALPTGLGIGLIAYFTLNYLPDTLEIQGG